MEHKHLDAAALERQLAADRTAEQNEQLFHLLAVCPPCREVGGWLLELHQANILPPVFGLIDAALAREPRLVLCIRHNLVDNLSKMGRHKEAADLLPELRELAAAQGGALDRLRLSWVEGRAAAGLGEQERARLLLGSVRQAFLDDANPFEAALATLDLVVSHLKEGNTAEVRVLADEMVAVFRAHNVPREALAAVLLFQEAAHREAASVELAREVAALLSRAHRAGEVHQSRGEGEVLH